MRRRCHGDRDDWLLLSDWMIWPVIDDEFSERSIRERTLLQVLRGRDRDSESKGYLLLERLPGVLA